jgi:hypothetical protein
VVELWEDRALMETGERGGFAVGISSKSNNQGKPEVGQSGKRRGGAEASVKRKRIVTWRAQRWKRSCEAPWAAIWLADGAWGLTFFFFAAIIRLLAICVVVYWW